MLDISISIQGDKVLIEGLERFAGEFLGAILKGLERSAKDIHRTAYMWLSGAKTTGRGKGKMQAASGGYPVPVRTGWLRRMLDWLKPGESKTGEAGTFSAGPNEVVLYDSALYANVIHEGRLSSAKFGPRRFLIDAFEMFNRGLGVQRKIMEEVQIAKAKAGLK